MLEIGTKAPDFTLADQNGEMILSLITKGRRWYYIFVRKI